MAPHPNGDDLLKLLGLSAEAPEALAPRVDETFDLPRDVWLGKHDRD